jgi:hypothetical protein
LFHCIYFRYTNHRNIYLLDSVTNMNMARDHDRFYNETPGELSRPQHSLSIILPPVFRDNLYWSHEASDMAGPIFPEKKDWATWTRGNDINSEWTTVPVFRCTSLTGSKVLQGRRRGRLHPGAWQPGGRTRHLPD